MKFSAQEEYGLRCLLSLARIKDDESLTIPEISHLEGMSNSHVAKILSILRKDGFITSTRGQLGGYKLARDPQDMSIQDIMVSLGGRLITDEFCVRHAGIEAVCVHESDCSLRPLWLSIQSAVEDITRRISLADLLHRRIEEPLVHLSTPDERPVVSKS